MNAIIAELCSRYGVVVSPHGGVADVVFEMMETDQHPVIVRLAEDQEDPEDILVQCRIDVDLPVWGQVRVDKYLSNLAEQLTANTSTKVFVKPPYGLILQGMVGVDSFADPEASVRMTDGIDFLIQQYVTLLHSASLGICISHKLYEMRGTSQYRKLSPSRLAALTLCGMYDDASMH